MLCGDATVSYLYSDYARRQILARNPRARIIVMVRRREDFIKSYYTQICKSREEYELPPLEEWWELELPSTYETIEEVKDWDLHVREFARFEKYIRKYIADFGSGQVLVIQADQRIGLEKFNQVLDFLGVRRVEEGEIDFSLVNPRGALPQWWKVLRKVLPLRQAALFWRNRLSLPSLGLLERIENRLNAKPEAEPVLSESIRAELTEIDFASLDCRKILAD